MTRFSIRGPTAFAAFAITACAATSWSSPICTSSYHIVASVDTPGLSRNLALEGDYLYVADENSGLQVIDVSNPRIPSIVGSLPGNATAVYVVGSYAYTLGSAGLRVVDVSNPAMPVVLGSGPGGTRLVVVGDFAYIANGNGDLRIVDVSDPNLPALVGTLVTPGTATDVAVAGNYAYVPDDHAGVHVVDITNPAAPAIVGTFNSTGQNHYVALVGNYLYANNSQVGMEVIDISVPTTPTFVTALAVPFNSIAVVGSSVYMTLGNQVIALAVLDATTPAKPEVVKSIYVDYFPNDVVVGGDYAYVALGGVVNVVDLSPANLVVGSLDTPGDALGLAVVGDYAYIADGLSGFHVVDVSTPATPVVSGTLQPSGQPRDVVVAGDYAYLPMGAAGLRVVDVSVPSSPVGVATLGGDFVSAALAGNHLYATVNGFMPFLPKRFRVYDLATPSNPVFRGAIDTPGSAYDIAMFGNYAYVADGSALIVIDVSAPNAPAIVGSVTTLGIARSVALAGNYAYVADGTAGLQVIDISVPTAPAIVGNVSTQREAGKVAVVDGRVHVMESQWSTLMYVIDVDTPSNPVIVGKVDAPGTPSAAVGLGNYIYVTAGAGGLVIYPPLCGAITDSNDPAATTSALGLIQRVATGLQIRYAIANTADRITLSIYDVRGQRVRMLYRGPHEPGLFFRVWDGYGEGGHPSASGVYFVRLEVDSRSYAHKAIWLR